MKRLSTIILLLALWISASAQVSFGDSKLFNDGWSFVQADLQDAESPGFSDSSWDAVRIPHDWSIKGLLSPDNASCTGYLPAGTGWYRKHFDRSEISEDKAFIYFEGVYNRSSVYLNGNLLGRRPSGYNSFMYELTPYLRNGDNVIAVRVGHSRIADSRWYTGSGIYRNVWLIQSGPVHFSQWGIGYRTESMTDKQAVVIVEAAIDGLEGSGYKVCAELYNASGTMVAKDEARAEGNTVMRLKVDNPRCWDITDPYMYTLKVTLANRNRVVDAAEINAGLRTLEFDADRGFALNGRNVKVKGVCLHHDAGVLGSAVPDDVLERRLRTLISLGVNAVRTSHNPQSPEFYDLCDRLGLLVMDEAFDEWEFNKKKWVDGWNVGTPAHDGTADFFKEWGEKDVKDMVRRDRNHPSIFLWSIGNEVDYPNDPYSHPILNGGNNDFTQPVSGGYKPEAPSVMRIGEIARKLAACVRSVDTSRPVTGALAGVAMSNQTGYPEAIDVVGYNYTESRYTKDHKIYPKRIIYGSENRPDFASWKAVRDNDHIFGQFIWTGVDYLGESGVWPSRGFYSGLLDLAGNIKPRGHFKAAAWSGSPVCYIGTYLKEEGADSMDAWDSWNYEPGQTVRVVCYTNADKACLKLNGDIVGEMTKHNDDTGIIGWDVPYAPGRLVAEGYSASGRKESEYEICTSSRPKSLQSRLLAPSGQVLQIMVEVLDDKGEVANLADSEITCTVEGDGELLGLESGDNTDMGNWNDNIQRAYRGRLVAYILRGHGKGEVSVRFTSPYLKATELSVPRK